MAGMAGMAGWRAANASQRALPLLGQEQTSCRTYAAGDADAFLASCRCASWARACIRRIQRRSSGQHGLETRMLIIPASDPVDEEPRTHPWNRTAYDEDAGAYVNFVEHPERIPTSLEDYVPHGDQAAAKTFYSMLAWV